jgi:excisionase family DNA binding protein
MAAVTELLTPKEVRELLRVSAATFDRMVARQEIRVFRLGGSARRPLRVNRHDLEEALASWSVRTSR